MTDLGYIAISSGCGLAFATAAIALRRRQEELLGWRPVALATVTFVIAFSAVRSLSGLFVGHKSVPAWSGTTGHLWMPALGLVNLLGLHLRSNGEPDVHRTSGYFFLSFGVLLVADDIYSFLHGA